MKSIFQSIVVEKDETNMSCSSISQDSKSFATFRRIIQNLHFEFDAEKSSQSSSEYSTQSAVRGCPPTSEIMVMGNTGKKKKSAPKAAAAAAVSAAESKKRKGSAGASGSSSRKKTMKARKKSPPKALPVASQSEDEEEEEQEEEEVVLHTDDEYDAEDQVESSDESESSEEEEEEEVDQPKPKSKRVVAAAKKNDAPSFNPHGEDPFNPTYPSMMNLRKEGEESERQFKERSAAMGAVQVTPGAGAFTTDHQDIDWVRADLIKPHKRVEECLEVIRKSPVRSTLSREDCAKFGKLEWDVAMMERQCIELKRKNLELEASWELLNTSKKAKKGGQLSKAQAQMVSEAHGAINSTILRMVKWPKSGWTNYSSNPNSICQMMLPKISLPPGLEGKQIEVLWNEVIAPALPRMMTQARNGILQPMRTRFYSKIFRVMIVMGEILTFLR